MCMHALYAYRPTIPIELLQYILFAQATIISWMKVHKAITYMYMYITIL